MRRISDSDRIDEIFGRVSITEAFALRERVMLICKIRNIAPVMTQPAKRGGKPKSQEMLPGVENKS